MSPRILASLLLSTLVSGCALDSTEAPRVEKSSSRIIDGVASYTAVEPEDTGTPTSSVADVFLGGYRF